MKREWLVLVLAMTFPSAMAYLYFVRFAGAGEGTADNRLVQIVYTSAKLAMIVLPIAYVAMTDRRYRPFEKQSSNRLGMAIFFGLAVAFTMFALSNYLAGSVLAECPQRVRTKISEFGINTPIRYLLMSLFLSTIHAFLEEYYWRWFVFGRLRKLMAFLPAALISGLAFAGHHVFVLNEYLPGQFWNATIPFSLGIAFGGVVWAWIYEKTGSLLGPWLSHLLVDAAVMYIGYRMNFFDAIRP